MEADVSKLQFVLVVIPLFHRERSVVLLIFEFHQLIVALEIGILCIDADEQGEQDPDLCLEQGDRADVSCHFPDRDHAVDRLDPHVRVHCHGKYVLYEHRPHPDLHAVPDRLLLGILDIVAGCHALPADHVEHFKDPDILAPGIVTDQLQEKPVDPSALHLDLIAVVADLPLFCLAFTPDIDGQYQHPEEQVIADRGCEEAIHHACALIRHGDKEPCHGGNRPDAGKHGTEQIQRFDHILTHPPHLICVAVRLRDEFQCAVALQYIIVHVHCLVPDVPVLAVGDELPAHFHKSQHRTVDQLDQHLTSHHDKCKRQDRVPVRTRHQHIHDPRAQDHRDKRLGAVCQRIQDSDGDERRT